jgi:hypothetical protein
MDVIILFMQFLKFWFIDGPIGLVNYFSSFNKAFLELFSLGLLVKTFFKPWKNEYRKGLVGFSIGMGIAIKSIVILVDILVFLVLLLAEGVFLLGFILWPFATVGLLFL